MVPGGIAQEQVPHDASLEPDGQGYVVPLRPGCRPPPEELHYVEYVDAVVEEVVQPAALKAAAQRLDLSDLLPSIILLASR